MRAIILDTGVLSLVADKPGKSPAVIAVQNWLATLLTAGIKIYVPEICDYELRRELVRSQKTSSLVRLNALVSGTEYLLITTPVMHQAAQLWALARNNGTPTSDDTALDGDIILCAQVQSLGIPSTDYIVATTNTKHLKWFVSADEWQNISL
jgi:hypothetical protein